MRTPSMKGPKMSSIDSPELIFLNKIHEMTSRADVLIEKYVETAAIINSLPPEMELPNREEAFELASNTALLLSELKTTVVYLTEHSAKVDDQVQKVLDRFKDRTKD
jgi:hypothetical protein